MVRLGQNFLADTNLLDAIVREAALGRDDVVLEVGGGEGALTGELASRVAGVHVIELDERLRPALEAVRAEHGNVALHFADAMRFELAALEPAPTRIVANLPYAIATPLIIRTIAEQIRVGEKLLARRTTAAHLALGSVPARSPAEHPGRVRLHELLQRRVTDAASIGDRLGGGDHVGRLVSPARAPAAAREREHRSRPARGRRAPRPPPRAARRTWDR